MKILILGAGVTGVATAYMLASRGHEVEVIDEDNGPAQQCSFANGCQLSYSYADPISSRENLKKAMKWMFKADAPLVFRPKFSFELLKWTVEFLSNCSAERERENGITMLRLGLYSREKMKQIIDDTNIQFDYLERGILRLFETQKAYDEACDHAEYLSTIGMKKEFLSPELVFQREPALKQMHSPLAGGIFTPMDASGDVHVFTREIARICAEDLGVTFHFKTKLAWMHRDGDRISAVETSRGMMKADAYIVCLGSHSTPYLKPLGVHLPITPMKGYSVTVPAWNNAPQISLGDEANKIVYSRIGNRVRAAGTAEFAGFDYRIRRKRILPILRSMTTLFPEADVSVAEKWACLRPQTPDSPPIIGKSPLKNMYLNTGHGMLGWTHGAGSAHLLADILEERATEIPLDGLTLARF